ncbi:centrosomal protein CCDC61-like [Lycorma delicatula]|uniref:centrosomal protein CCDC61-like n=1 Tax=Lycorma delicatula TaxID=130591 RepID=UPI003F51052F
MNDSSSYLVTIYTFKGKDYLVKMNVLNKNTLELKVTDKITSEDWHCSYDSTYIENLTHKTGNYKQFDIFTTMLKSGLLKTSESITLDLLTFDDLEALRSRRIMGRTFPPHSAHILPASASNRRYLILTYTVEFDRIHYPLPMEYCGLPDPHILQSTIRRLEQEIVQLQDQLSHSGTQCCDEDLVEQVNILEKRVLELTSENDQLRSEIIRLNNQLNKKQPTQKHAEVLQNALLTLEEQVQKERLSLHHQIRNLKEEKKHLNSQLLLFNLQPEYLSP